MNHIKKYPALLALLLGLAITTAAFAANTDINTDDGQVDPNWSIVSPLTSDGDDIGNDNYDINQAWVVSNAGQSAYYFRVNLIGSGRLPHDYSSFEARLDCDQNGSFLDSADIVVYYAIASSYEEVVECQGSDYPNCDFTPEPNHSDTNPDVFGEEVLSGVYNYEWRADVNNGAADWSQCFNTVNIQITSLDPSFVVQDISAWQEYNAPTAVDLAVFEAKSYPNPAPSLLAGVLILGLLVSAWMVHWAARRWAVRPQ